MKPLVMLAGLLAGGTACAAMADAAAAPPRGQQFQPKWHVGDRWTVETESRQLQTANPQPSSVKARWRFAVQAVERVAGENCFRIVAQPLEAEQPETVVWVDRKTAAIRQIQTQLPTPAGYKTVTESYRSSTPSPVVGPLSVLPIALPQFPQPGIKSLESWRINKAAAGAGASVGGEDG